METLASLLSPYPLQEFLQENWTQKGVFIPAERRDKFAHLFSWQDLNYLLNFHNYTYPDLRFSQGGRVLSPCSAKDWVKRCQEGATLILNHVHQRVPVLAELAAALHRELGHRVQVNTYCSWPSQQGFSCHYDTHEVFILQIKGNKEWFVFEDTIKYPRKNARTLGVEPPESDPYIHEVLQPGDLLYIPRGHWHYAIACDRPSLHLTLGIPGRTGVDWLRWLVGELQNDPAWRENLPLATTEDTAALEYHLHGLVDRLIDTLKQEKWVQKYARSHSHRSDRVPEISLPSQAGFDVFADGFDTQFRRAKFQNLRIEWQPETEQYQLAFAHKEINLTNVTDRFVQNLRQRHQFTVWEAMDWLPECDLEADILPLLWELVREGVLAVDSPDFPE
jgi:ribosomal protein L16 Arg81 hydroxylase